MSRCSDLLAAGEQVQGAADVGGVGAGVRARLLAGRGARHHRRQHLQRIHRLLELHVRAVGVRSLLHTDKTSQG